MKMNREIQILPLSRSSRDIMRFLSVSYGIYRDDPHWVAPLLMDLKKVFTDANPFFRHASMQLWVARRNGDDVGRIAGIIDRNYNERQNTSAAFFGFFESENDSDTSHRLFESAFAWARASGVQRMLGPVSPSTNDECGLLMQGFDTSPVFMMAYNPRYYVDLVANSGFHKAKDLLAFHIDLSRLPMDRLSRIAAKVKARHANLVFRAVRRRTLDQDLAKIKDVYNAAWQGNWGFVPMTDAEVDFMASRLRPLFMEGLIWLAEAGQETVGFLLALPDYNVPLKPLRGHLLTPRIVGFIPYVLGWRRPPLARVLTLGVKEHYRGRGLESAMLIEGLTVGCAAGFTESEASWILEDNVMMRRVMEAVGGRPYKIYRIWERDL